MGPFHFSILAFTVLHFTLSAHAFKAEYFHGAFLTGALYHEDEMYVCVLYYCECESVYS